MSSSFAFHWVLLVFAAAFAVAGVIVVIRALFRDRARGRPRCPSCWYDMSGTAALKCPECGRDARTNKRLFKTRRHWKRAVAGVLMVCVAATGYAGQRVMEKGTLGAIPTAGYIAALPWLEPGTPAMKEFLPRVSSGTMRQWEYRYLVRQCIRELPKSREPAKRIDLLGILTEIQQGGSRTARKKPYASWALATDIEPRGTVDAFIAAVNDPDVHVRLKALSGLSVCDDKAVRAIPAVVQCLDNGGGTLSGYAKSFCLNLDWTDPDKPLQHNGDTFLPFSHYDKTTALRCTLGACGSDTARALRILFDGLMYGSYDERAMAIWALSHLAADDPAIVDGILAYHNHRFHGVRANVVQSLVRLPFDDRIQAILKERLSDSSPLVVEHALKTVAKLGRRAASLQDHVKPHLQMTEQVDLTMYAAHAWIHIGGDPAEADRLFAPVLATPFGASPAFFTLERVEQTSGLPATRVQLAEHCKSSNLRLRATAAYLDARCGGDDAAATRAVLDHVAQDHRDGFPSHPLLSDLTRSGNLHVPTISGWLDSDEALFRLIAAEQLSEAGASAVEVLPTLRRLRGDADPAVAAMAQHAVKRIEWEIRHPEEAARRRQQ